jgi:hypothetical protein
MSSSQLAIPQRCREQRSSIDTLGSNRQPCTSGDQYESQDVRGLSVSVKLPQDFTRTSFYFQLDAAFLIWKIEIDPPEFRSELVLTQENDVMQSHDLFEASLKVDFRADLIPIRLK